MKFEEALVLLRHRFLIRRQSWATGVWLYLNGDNRLMRRSPVVSSEPVPVIFVDDALADDWEVQSFRV